MKLQRLWNKLDAVRRSQLRYWRRRLFSAPVDGKLADCHLVFVIAAPRSGTTWLQRALNEHPQITCGENRLFGSHFDVVNGPGHHRLRITMDEYAVTLAQRTKSQEFPISDDAYAEELTAGFARVTFDLWRKYSGKSILVDKVTPYPGTADDVVRQIRRFFPSASIIQLIRDGRDVVTSGVFHWLIKSQDGRSATDTEQQRRAVFVEGQTEHPLERFFSDEDITNWAATWREPMTALSGLATDRVLRVRYEDMISNQFRELQRICQHIGADHDDGVLNPCVRLSSFQRMSGGRQQGQMEATAHVRRGVVGDWKNYFTKRDGELFDQECGGLLHKLGYETDRNWLSELPTELCSTNRAA